MSVFGPDGLHSGARQVASPNFDDRPGGIQPTLLVVHSISLPPGEFGGTAIEELFTNRLDPAAHPAFTELESLRVSAHFLIRRDGELIQFVPIHRRAWHAGVSTWRAQTRCNDFSIGVELEGLEGEAFDERQYPVLAALVDSVAARYPIVDVAGHEHVAPGRKNDPGAGFDWARLRRLVRAPALRFAP